MEEEISKYFGPVVNGKSGKTTTDLCLNRWKATLLTCPEMLQYMEKQMQDREAAAKEKAAIQAQREADKAMRTVGATKSCDGGNTTRCKAKVLKTGIWLGILHRFQVQLFHLSEMQLRNDEHSFDHGTQQFKLIYIYKYS